MKKNKPKDLDYWCKRLYHGTLRYALSGMGTGLKVDDIMRILGEEESIRRIESYCKILEDYGKTE